MFDVHPSTIMRSRNINLGVSCFLHRCAFSDPPCQEEVLVRTTSLCPARYRGNCISRRKMVRLTRGNPPFVSPKPGFCQCSLTSPHATVESRLFLCACISAICSSVLSMGLFINGAFPALSTPKSHRTTDPPRRISTYLNLDKVHRNASEKFTPIDSFAYVVLQLQNDDPRRKLYEDDRMYYSREGAIYPDDRHFLVTKEVGLTVQRRVGWLTAHNHFILADIYDHAIPQHGPPDGTVRNPGSRPTQ